MIVYMTAFVVSKGLSLIDVVGDNLSRGLNATYVPLSFIPFLST